MSFGVDVGKGAAAAGSRSGGSSAARAASAAVPSQRSVRPTSRACTWYGSRPSRRTPALAAPVTVP
ncbi:hypothetical protein [Micromonospora sp. CA-246542]|uniref:hypothetical protein n=1 Tax=Micromonospora sp. CA-246542 TaxID=3239959 RepID=UPI003D8B8CC1